MADAASEILGNVGVQEAIKAARVVQPGKQQRFLDAFRQCPVIVQAARLANVHRATVYRWLADPSFVEAMRAAWEVFFQANLVKVEAAQAARKRWREARERARYPMRCHYLALARAMKRR